MTRKRSLKLLAWIGVPIAVIVAIILVWNWDWFIPMVDARASADIGRPVTIGHLHVRLGRIITVAADDVTIANPPGWPGTPLARIQRVVTQVNLLRYIFHRQLVIPLVEIDRPLVSAVEAPNGQANWRLAIQGGSGGTTQIGDLRIAGGMVHVLVPRLRANFDVAIETREQPGQEPRLLAEARGTYAAQPIDARMIGGAILALRDTTHPWPINLQITNGPTRVELVGSVRDPLALAGADLRLRLAGPDMGRLEPLTGIPIPTTPPYQVTGQLDFANHQVRFQNFQGRVGSSDLEGTIAVNPGQPREVVIADLRSRLLNLADLGGFIGAKPGANVQRAPAATVFPTKPIHVPELHWADVHLRYRAGRIEGRSMPLDNFAAALDIVNGQIDLHPVSFGVGVGRIVASAKLREVGPELHTTAEINFESVDVAKLMASTHLFHGAGTISGSDRIVTTGNSIAAMAANGNGEVLLGMVGGDMSSILVDLAGLQFGNALLSALGVPKNAQVECMVGNFALTRGVMQTKALILDTNEAIVTGTGTADLRNEKLDLQIRSRPRHITIGSLAGPINIGGTIKHPSILPGVETIARGGLAAALGAIFPPLAALPTIQFGASDHGACDRLLAEARSASPGTKVPAPRTAESR